MLVTMLLNAACPDWILEAGKSYDLPAKLAQRFLADSVTDPVTGEVIKRHPAARLADPKEKGFRLCKVISPPDPEERSYLAQNSNAEDWDDDEK